MEGALLVLAIRKVFTLTGLHRGLDTVLEFRESVKDPERAGSAVGLERSLRREDEFSRALSHPSGVIG